MTPTGGYRRIFTDTYADVAASTTVDIYTCPPDMQSTVEVRNTKALTSVGGGQSGNLGVYIRQLDGAGNNLDSVLVENLPIVYGFGITTAQPAFAGWKSNATDQPFRYFLKPGDKIRIANTAVVGIRIRFIAVEEENSDI